MKSLRRCFVLAVVIISILLLFSTYTKVYECFVSYDVKPDLIKVMDNLVEIHREIHSDKTRIELETQMNKILAILKALGFDYDYQKEQKLGNVNYLHEVCPEIYKGKDLTYDYPFYRKGFGSITCKEYKPIKNLITVLMHISSRYNPEESLKNLASFYPGISVTLLTEYNLNLSLLTAANKLDLVFKSKTVSRAELSNALSGLINDITTPYVFIAQDMTIFNDDINLERLIRMLSYYPNLAIAGGALRNIDGKWDIGCEQVTYRNWTARYKGGYYRAFNDCIVCDHLKAPFAVKTKILKDIKLDPSMKEGLYHDFFWRVRQAKTTNVIMSCPDVMSHIKKRNISDPDYISFANKHEIHKIIEADGLVRWYGCRKGFPWTSSKHCSISKGMALSPATMENMADGIKMFMKVCEEIGAFCEIQSGTAVGAVKLNGVLPWERDADLDLLSANYTAFEKQVDRFKKAGFQLIPQKRPTVNSDGVYSDGYMALRSGLMTIEIWAVPKVGAHMMAQRGELPTKVHFAGEWLILPHNPGLFVRNRYGAGIYEHVSHWGVVGHKTGWKFYKTGSFPKCRRPGHTACLDQYPAVGNMQFRDYPC